MKLVLIRNGSEFAGIVGTETGKEVNGVSVCIGDKVKVQAGESHRECVGVVGCFTNKISVMGLASRPISTLNILSIEESHTHLTVGSKLQDGYHIVEEFQK